MKNGELTAREKWELEFPDARAKVSRNEKRGPLGFFEAVFCVNCGIPGGHVLKLWANHVFYLCEKCAETHGNLPIPEADEQTVRGGK